MECKPDMGVMREWVVRVLFQLQSYPYIRVLFALLFTLIGRMLGLRYGTYVPVTSVIFLVQSSKGPEVSSMFSFPRRILKGACVSVSMGETGNEYECERELSVYVYLN